jgi:hypothetical protein
MNTESHFQWSLHLICGVGGEAHKLDVILLTGVNDLGGELSPINTFFARQAAGTRQLSLEKPVLADGHVKPA